MFPANEEEATEVLLALKLEDFVFKVEVGGRTYWVWRFRWKSSSPDTIIVYLPPNREDPNWAMELTDMMKGTPDEAAVRARLVEIAPA